MQHDPTKGQRLQPAAITPARPSRRSATSATRSPINPRLTLLGARRNVPVATALFLLGGISVHMRIQRSRLALLLAVALALPAAAPIAAIAKPATGCTTATALVFNPNPVATSGNIFLTDQNDADYAALNNERVRVTLTGLDGSGYLRGTWATVVSETGDPAYEPDCTYDYTRHDDRFEQVMAYYWVTRSQDYTRSLGFGVNAGWPAVNGDQQRVRINQWGADNSFATDHPKDEMRFGKGGVDDAEDGEVILHELGHQIHFSASSTFFATNEAGGISEGFGDYWAATVSEWSAG